MRRVTYKRGWFKLNKENPHNGCCNRHNCKQDLDNCCYTARRTDNYNFINLRK